MRRMTRCVRSTDAASGKLHVDQQVALVLAGMKPEGEFGESPPRQHQQAAVEHQHQHAHPQQHADGPAVKVGRVIEAAIEEVEGPAEDVVQRPGEEPTGESHDGRGCPWQAQQHVLCPTRRQQARRLHQPIGH